MTDMICLIEPAIPALRRYAQGLMRDPSAADDLVQDCLEHAVSRWHQRRAGGDARTWMFSILHNLAISRLRQNQRRGRHVTLDDIDEGATSRPPPQEHSVRHGELLRSLDLLPEDLRSVLLLVSVEDLSYAEAARVLDIPIGTVMSRLSRARERLARLMNAEAPASDAPMLRRVK
jgi:RNA polymerase sigma-70 factor (ECF subfamily)